MNETNTVAPTADLPCRVTPDLTPRLVPEWAAVEKEVRLAESFLGHVATDSEDPRNENALRLLERNDQSGRTRLDEIARLAHRMACDPVDPPLEQIEPFLVAMDELVFGYSENVGDYVSPLYFIKPTPLLEVLEFTISWHSVAAEPATAFSTRQLARLARIDTNVMEQQLDVDHIFYQPYGISLQEMDDMTAAEQLFWLHQNFVFSLHDAIGWLSKFPGFTLPKRVIC